MCNCVFHMHYFVSFSGFTKQSLMCCCVFHMHYFVSFSGFTKQSLMCVSGVKVTITDLVMALMTMSGDLVEWPLFKARRSSQSLVDHCTVSLCPIQVRRRFIIAICNNNNNNIFCPVAVETLGLLTDDAQLSQTRLAGEQRFAQPICLSLIHIWRCRRIERCRSRWSPYH